MDDFLTKAAFTALGAVATFLLQIAARRAEQRAKIFAARLDEFCDAASDLAIAAAAYWMLAPTDPALPEMEARTFRLNHRMITMAGLLSESKPEFLLKLSEFISDLTDAATGGGFQVAGRLADPARFASIEWAATSVIRETRRYQSRLWSGWFW